MTDNIEKLYEIAGVYLCNMPDIDCSKECDKCEDYNPFTAEKQLELIKWVSDIFIFRTYARLKKETTCFLTEREYGCDEYFCKSSTLEQALAGLIIDLWRDLTGDQKQEIKEILQ